AGVGRIPHQTRKSPAATRNTPRSPTLNMLASRPHNTKLVTGPPRVKKIFCKAPTRGCERDATAFLVKACGPRHELVMCNKLVGSLGWKEPAATVMDADWAA